MRHLDILYISFKLIDRWSWAKSGYPDGIRTSTHPWIDACLMDHGNMILHMAISIDDMSCRMIYIIYHIGLNLTCHICLILRSRVSDTKVLTTRIHDTCMELFTFLVFPIPWIWYIDTCVCITYLSDAVFYGQWQYETVNNSYNGVILTDEM